MSEETGERQSVTVEIGGERHVLRTDAPPEYTQSVAAHVDSTLRSLGGVAAMDPHRAAILAALVITDQLFRERSELAAVRTELARRCGRLAARLESITVRE